MKPRTFARTPSSIGSNQLSKSRPSASPARANVVLLFMAWSPAWRSNAGNQGCEPRRLRNPYSNRPRNSTSRGVAGTIRAAGGRGAHTAVGDCDERLMLRPIVPVEHPMRHALRKAQVQDALRIARLGSDLVVFLPLIDVRGQLRFQRLCG